MENTLFVVAQVTRAKNNLLDFARVVKNSAEGGGVRRPEFKGLEWRKQEEGVG